MVTFPENFIYLFPLAYGLLVGIVELVFLSHDEAGLHWFGHGMHAFPWAIIFTYVSVNTWVAGSFLPMIPSWLLIYVVPAVLAIVTAFKVKMAVAIAKGGTVGEKLSHALIIGILVGVAPFVFWILGTLGIEALNVILR